jgi:hypothetical protein
MSNNGILRIFVIESYFVDNDCLDEMPINCFDDIDKADEFLKNHKVEGFTEISENETSVVKGYKKYFKNDNEMISYKYQILFITDKEKDTFREKVM